MLILFEDAAALLSLAKENHFGTLLAHAPYTLNPASAKPEVREFAEQTMRDDLERRAHFPGSYYNFHPGSHTGLGVEKGIEEIVRILNAILPTSDVTTVLLEGMSGKGTEIGSRFEELAEILAGVTQEEKMGVCLDTCHLHEAGYDIVNDLDSVLEEFDAVVGLERLKAIHLNDSKNPRGAHKDRHEKIGKGYIGLEAIVRIINHPELQHLPFYLETPNELKGYKEEIAMLRQSWAG